MDRKVAKQPRRRLWIVLGSLVVAAGIAVAIALLMASRAGLPPGVLLPILKAEAVHRLQDHGQPRQADNPSSTGVDQPRVPRLNPSAASGSGTSGDRRWTPMDIATKDVLDSENFILFAASTKLPPEKQAAVAKIVALAKLNTETARRSSDAEVRTRAPERLRKDAYIQIIAPLAKAEREAFDRAGIMEDWLPQPADPSAP